LKKLIAVQQPKPEFEPEIIMVGCVTDLLIQWFANEEAAEIKARILTPSVLELLQHSHKHGKITDQELTDAVMLALVKAATQRLGFYAVEYVSGERRNHDKDVSVPQNVR